MDIHRCVECKEYVDVTQDEGEWTLDYPMQGCDNAFICGECLKSALLKTHGIEDNGYSLQQAKAITGVARIEAHKGISIADKADADYQTENFRRN